MSPFTCPIEGEKKPHRSALKSYSFQTPLKAFYVLLGVGKSHTCNVKNNDITMTMFTLFGEKFPAAVLALEVTFYFFFSNNLPPGILNKLKRICCMGWITGDTHMTKHFCMGK